jgi:hypothetical protein
MNPDLAGEIKAAAATGTARTTWPTRIGIAQRDGAFHAFALEAIAPGEVVLEINGLLVDRPDRYSVQIGEQLHMRPPAELGPTEDVAAYRWRFLNHSCRPNASVRGTLLVALTPIAAGEEVSFDYNTTELEIACPFKCHCGHCGGAMIRGFAHLGPAEQRQREPFLGAHLSRALLAARR